MFRANGQLAELPSCLLRAAEVRLARGNLTGAEQAADEAAALFTHQRRERLGGRTPPTWPCRSGPGARGCRIAWSTSCAAPPTSSTTTAGSAEALRLPTGRDPPPGGGQGPAVTPPDAPLRRAVRLGRTRTASCWPTSTRVAARQRRRPGQRRAGPSPAGCASPSPPRPGSARWRPGRTPPVTATTSPSSVLASPSTTAGRVSCSARIEATRLMSSRMPMLRPPDDEAMAAMLTELRSLGVRIADAATPTSRRIEDEHQRILLERRVLHHARGARGDRAAEPASWERELARRARHARPPPAAGLRPRRRSAVVVSVWRGRAHPARPRPRRPTSAGDSTRSRSPSIVSTAGRARPRRAAPPTSCSTWPPPSWPAQLLPAEIADGRRRRSSSCRPRGSTTCRGGCCRRSPAAPSRSTRRSRAWAKAEQMRASTACRSTAATVRPGSIAGPGLAHAAAEVDALRRLLRLAGRARAARRDRRALRSSSSRGSDVVHFACHGSFRTDNPMFSSLGLDDGPLVVYDFERLQPAPRDGGAVGVQPGQRPGAAGRFAARSRRRPDRARRGATSSPRWSPISDSSSVEVMSVVHRAMAAGAAPAAALACASGRAQRAVGRGHRRLVRRPRRVGPPPARPAPGGRGPGGEELRHIAYQRAVKLLPIDVNVRRPERGFRDGS